MEILLVGLNHKTAPVEIREKMSASPASGENFLEGIINLPNITEGLYLATCNRVEVTVIANSVDSGVMEIKNFLADYYKFSREEFETFLYIFSSTQAIRHIFRVAASLDSMIVGEPQILGQVKEAYNHASDKGILGMVLNRLFHKAFSAAKRVRTETSIAKNPVSISFAAVELAKKIFISLEKKTVLLIGAGEMSELALKHLSSNGVQKIIIANRTFQRAQNLAEEFKGEAIIFSDLYNYLPRADIIISSTGSSDFIITYPKVRQALKERRNRPMFFIDIAVPRDIEPNINKLDNVYLYDIDDLQGVVDDNLEERNKEALKAEKIINEEVDKFIGMLRTVEVTPTILSLRKKLEEIGKDELKKTIARLTNINEKDKKVLELLTVSIVNKIAHHPITFLKKKVADGNTGFSIDLVRELFHLDK